MNEFVGLLIVFGFIIALPAGASWLLFHHLGRVHNITTVSAARDYLRKDLDVGPLTAWRVNWVYRAVMRGTGIKSPGGHVMEVRRVTLAMPVEDYGFAQQFGIDEFEKGLRDYRHNYALKQGWYPPSHEPVPVAVWPDERRRRLRPIPTFEWPQDGSTRTLTSPARRTSHLGDRTEPLKDSCRVTFKDQTWILTPQGAPYMLGRGPENHIRTVHDTISHRHAIIRYTGEGWVWDPLDGATNPAKIGGRIVSTPTPLTSETVVMIGEAEPLRFYEGPAGGREKTRRT